MFFKTFFVITFFLWSCARPNYQNQLTLELNKPTNQSEKCPLSMKRLNLCLTLNWESIPTDSNMGVLTLQFSAQPPTDQLQVFLWMPSMNHSSNPTEVQSLGDGVFRISKIYFMMPGEWEMRIRIKQDGQILDEAIQKIIY